MELLKLFYKGCCIAYKYIYIYIIRRETATKGNSMEAKLDCISINLTDNFINISRIISLKI